MHCSKLLIVALCLSYVAFSDAFFHLFFAGPAIGAAALVLGGLGALKAAAIIGYSAGHFYSRRNSQRRYGKRSISDDLEERENLLLSAVGQLDPSGCILKLLCKLQVKEERSRTPQENILVEMFANGTETLTSYNAAFVYAADIGDKTRDSSVCDEYFSKCPLGDSQLSALLQQAWGCGFNGFDEKEQSDATGIKI